MRKLLLILALSSPASGREVPVPIPPEASPTGRHFSSDLACSAGECLVVWMTWDDQVRWSYQIRGMRVSKDGRALDASSFTIAMGGMNTSRPQVIVSSDGYVVFYGGCLYATISPDGRVLSRDQKLSFSEDLASINDVVTAGGSVLVYYGVNQGPVIPHLIILDANLRDIRELHVDGIPENIATTGQEFVIASLTVDGLRVTRLSPDGSEITRGVIPQQIYSAGLAATPDSVLVAWRFTATNDAPAAIRCAAISRTEGLQPTQVLEQFVSQFGVASAPDVSATATGYLVNWSRPSNAYYTDNVYVRRVSAAGEPLDAQPLLVSTDPSMRFIAKSATIGGDVLVTWTDWRFGGGHDHVFGAIVPATGDVGPDFLISRQTPSQTGAVLAAAGTVTGVAWNESILISSGVVMFTRALPEVTPPLRLADSGGPPAIAAHDRLFIVAWREWSLVRVAFVDADGRLLVKTRLYGATFGAVSLAAGPDSVAVSWDDNGSIKLQRVRYDGTLFDAAPQVIATGIDPKVGFDGTDLWIVSRTSANAIEARRFNRDPVPFTVAAGSDPRDQLALACGNATCVALWRTQRAQQSSIDGVLLTSGVVVPGLVAAFAGTVAQPALTWNGSSYVVTWSENGHIAAAELSASGNLLGSTAITAADANEQTPAVTTVGTQPVFSFSRAARVYLRFETDDRRRAVRH